MLREWEEWGRRRKEQTRVTRGAEEAADISLSPTHWVAGLVDSDDSEAGHIANRHYKLAGPLEYGEPASLELI